MTSGIIRRVDALGRLNLPAEIRRAVGLTHRHELEIFAQNGEIVLMKREYMCVFCESCEDLQSFNDRLVCRGCIEELKG